ncbi:MAG: Fic family protein [Aminipila sp.]
MNEYKLPKLPPNFDLETKAVLKQLAKANRALAELKGYADTIPNKHILINAVTINEAKDSSEIENIITTHDDLYKAISDTAGATPESKEVIRYRTALWHGYEQVKAREILTTNMIIEVQSIIEKNRAGIRKLPGTVLRNEKTGEIVYTPPSNEEEIRELLKNLEIYINDVPGEIDPLIKLAVIHYQFEGIHPFYDGNGRTGRIINVLYLVLKKLLDSPILYLSGYIIRTKSDYYRLLQEVRTTDNWEDWVIYILYGIEETASDTLRIVKRINYEVEAMGSEIKEKLPKIFSKELVDLLFYEFYTKISYIEQGLSITRKTAAGYLNALEREGFLTSEKIGKERIYKNNRLYDLIKYKQQ